MTIKVDLLPIERKPQKLTMKDRFHIAVGGIMALTFGGCLSLYAFLTVAGPFIIGGLIVAALLRYLGVI